MEALVFLYEEQFTWTQVDYVYSGLRHVCEKEKFVQKVYKNEDFFTFYNNLSKN